jgi:hypothetical protein
MRFSAASVFVLASSVAAFQHSPAAFVARSTGASKFGNVALFSTAEDVDVEAPVKKLPTKKEERLRMMKSDRFHRKGFKEVRDGVESSMKQQYQSSIVKDLKTSNYLLEKDGVKVYLAKVGLIAIARYPPGAKTAPLQHIRGNVNLTMFFGCPTSNRTSDSAGGSNAVSLSRMKPSSTSPIRRSTSRMS